MRVVADADAVVDGPYQTGCQENVGAGELLAHQVLATVAKRDLDVTELLAEVFAGLGDDVGRITIDVTERIGAVATHHVQTGGIEFGDDEEAPLQPRRELL